MSACPVCGGELNRRSRPRLVAAGILFALLALGCVFAGGWIWLGALVLAFVAAYLFVWAIWGHGLWCRGCKTFPMEPG